MDRWTWMLLVISVAGPASARCPDYARLKNAYFGDLHTHTSYSLDAYTFGTRTDPAQAYAFATGAAVDIGLGYDASAGEVPGPLGVTIAASGGNLDFNAVTDHSEALATAYGCTADPTSPFYDGAWCAALRAGDDTPPGQIPCRGFTDLGATGCLTVQTNAWNAEQLATESANDPCTFTTFHGYEWTYSPGSTLHQNVIFRNANVPSVPIDAFDYPTATVMWAALADQCHAGFGCEALTIPHNMNLSAGLAFQTPGYAPTDLNRMLKFRRLVELHQHKGNSECLSDTSDTGVMTACDFEVRPQDAAPADEPGYARRGLEAGLERAASDGFDPAKLGFVGATDNHNATPGRVDEAGYTGHIGARDNTPTRALTGSARPANNPGGLTGAWAEENTRDAIFDAFLRRETFATSGPRIKVRFYEHTGIGNPCGDPAFPEQVVEGGGVPMGGTIPDRGVAPSFVVYALQDQTPLAAVDIVKASVAAGVAQEKVYTLPLSAPPYCVTWTDPDYDPAEPAFWYPRVREQPTWRWSHYRCEDLKLSNPSDWQTIAPGCASSDPGVGGLDFMVQERAWASSIWYLPGGPVTVRSRTLKLRDGSAAADPSRRRFTFKASTRNDADEHRVVMPSPGTLGDPTLHGGTLTVYNGTSGETFSATLSAAGWTLAGGGTRYTFADGAGAVQKVTVRADKLSAKGKGSAFGFSLDEPRQGAIAVRLQLGTAAPWCAEAPAKTSGTPRTSARFDLVDKFTGLSKAAPPDQCPVQASPSGAFIDCEAP